MATPRLLVALALLGLCSCSPPPDPPPRAPVTEVTPPPPTAPPAPPPPDPPREPVPALVELPANPACVLQGTWRARRGAAPMLTRPSGPAFASVSWGAARLHFPSSADGAAKPSTQGLEVEANGISVEGYIDSGVTDLRAAKPFWMNGVVLPTPYAMFDWTSATPGQLTVTTEAPKALEILQPPLGATRPCADIVLSTATFDPDDSIDGIKKSKPGQLVTGKPVDIAAEPGGKAVARAHAESGEEDVSVLLVRGGQSRVVWQIGTLVVVGWVASSAVHKARAGQGWGSGHGRLGGPRYASDHKKVVCPADVQLVVRIEEELAIPGVIRAGTTIELLALNGRYTIVRVRSEAIVPTREAQWMVLDSDLRDCQSAPE